MSATTLSLRDAIAVFVGGMVGTAVRAVLTLMPAVGWWQWAAVPFINVVGAFCLGLFLGSSAGRSRSHRAYLFLATGLLGGFTTYSALALESVTWLGVGIGLGTVVVGTAAAWGGLVIGKHGRAARP